MGDHGYVSIYGVKGWLVVVLIGHNGGNGTLEVEDALSIMKTVYNEEDAVDNAKETCREMCNKMIVHPHYYNTIASRCSALEMLM